MAARSTARPGARDSLAQERLDVSETDVSCEANPDVEQRRLHYISLFSGGFGLDLGMEQAELHVAACVEWEAAMRDTIRKNRPEVTVIGDEEGDEEGDVARIDPNTILRRAGIAKGEIDLVIGGPPCQSFSILGKQKGLDDPRGSLMLHFIRLLQGTAAKAFILENVSNLVKVHKGAAYEQIKRAFNAAGYAYVYTWVLNAADYGVPQLRDRVFIIGFHETLAAVADWGIGQGAPTPTHQPRPEDDTRREAVAPTLFDTLTGAQAASGDPRPFYKTAAEALSVSLDGVANHDLRPHGERVINRYKDLTPGKRDHVDHTDRLRPDRPSGTVLVGSSDGGGRPFIHYEEPRHLTVREAARLQGFPDSWVFHGTQTEQYRMVGNAVPPALAAAVGKRVAAYLRAALAASPPPGAGSTGPRNSSTTGKDALGTVTSDPSSHEVEIDNDSTKPTTHRAAAGQRSRTMARSG